MKKLVLLATLLALPTLSFSAIDWDVWMGDPDHLYQHPCDLTPEDDEDEEGKKECEKNHIVTELMAQGVLEQEYILDGNWCIEPPVVE